MKTPNSFNKSNFRKICNNLAKIDEQLKSIILRYGYPPMWTRPEGFSTLIHIILEQQVSIVAAKAAFHKLKEKIGKVTPKKISNLTDAELKSCYFSRQKIIYARELSNAVLSKKLNLAKLSVVSEKEIRIELTKIKGIGDWTVDVYLLFALQRTDIFPIGDLAAVNALKEIKMLPKDLPKEEILLAVDKWRPYRSIAAMLLWHYYIQTKGIKI